MPSQNEYNVAKQNGRIIHTKIFLLNYKLNIKKKQLQYNYFNLLFCIKKDATLHLYL